MEDEEVGFGGDGDGEGGVGEGAEDVDDVAWVDGGGCPVVMEVDCAAFRGGGDFDGECLEEKVSERCGWRGSKVPFGGRGG